MLVKPVQQLLLAVAFVFGLSFSSAWSAELIPLRATYSSIGGAFAPLWLAQDKGLFAKHGLAVELKYILSATGTQALFAGSVDIVNPATEIIEAGLGGQPGLSRPWTSENNRCNARPRTARETMSEGD